MAKVTKHHSGGERVLLFIGGIVCGYLTLKGLPYAFDSTTNQITMAFLGMGTAGGFYGALVGKQSM